MTERYACYCRSKVCSTAHITILQYYFTWCAIGPHNRIARVDITDCDNDLMILRAIEIQSGYMDMKGSTLWKVSIPL